MELKADGLTLRTPVDDDAQAVAAGVQLSLRELTPWMPWAFPDYDAEAAGQWIRGEFGDAHRFVMVDAADEIVGSCGLNHVDEQNHSANLGYWVRTDSVGRGCATMATRLLAEYGLGEAGYHRLEVKMSTHNGASRRVAEKAGATFEATLRGALLLCGEFHDTHLWSFVKGDDLSAANP